MVIKNVRIAGATDKYPRVVVEFDVDYDKSGTERFRLVETEFQVFVMEHVSEESEDAMGVFSWSTFHDEYGEITTKLAGLLTRKLQGAAE